ncbi:BaiN/RdsA family NAD(P)/FAD-dependent oxidoreductase [Celerinatantimonas yamalensis]|uniref:NAD(P)/FAD-dependent oxidoreductase n=1 Tax=Celerinatantimonas yamalensis TaxID=559956 RepID=A0ABW9GB75_9GAMM
MQHWDVVVIGAGAAGLMCAAQAAYRGRRVLLVDNAKKAGRKILISGGGRCNFTNINAQPQAYLCHNPHFVKSALTRYRAQDFIELVERHGLSFHEKTLGQLFCDESAQDLLDILLTELQYAGATLQLRTEILAVSTTDLGFVLTTSQGPLECDSLVVATGGLSMPKLGATPFGLKLAEQFGLNVYPTRAGLVPFTLHAHDKSRFEPLAGVSLDCLVSSESGHQFRENLLFTHRGLSGPAMLQISNYWWPGQALRINLLPDLDSHEWLKASARERARVSCKNLLNEQLPKRFVEVFLADFKDATTAIGQLPSEQRQQLALMLSEWLIKPNGNEGYRTAEVTLGGVDTDELSSKTMESKKVPGMYFIGEVVDVTGWLGGYNFQWAWSCGWAAGQAV